MSGRHRGANSRSSVVYVYHGMSEEKFEQQLCFGTLC